MTALATEHLSKNYRGVQALKDLSLEIAEGEAVGVIGPNGSGKSTLLQVVCGLTSISGGAVIISDRRLERIRSYKIIKYRVARTFQDARLINQMSAMDNLLIAMGKRPPFQAMLEFGKKDRLLRAAKMLKRVGLWEKRDALAGNLSYGQRKLLEISRAMATGADIFLLDEPFSGLFPEVIEIIVGLIQDMKRKGKTVILIEHNMSLITRLCERLIVLDAGKLLVEGDPKTVLNDPAVLEAYLGE